MIDILEFRKKTIEDLNKELTKVQKDLQNTVSDVLQGKEKNVRKVGLLKKDVARIKTIINEKFNEEQK
ncbi:50S ribosomal protein L29 [Patescibacteria group bacterium]|nr:50S ribosomal protein L29 [Patescibacteria group bacterium]